MAKQGMKRPETTNDKSKSKSNKSPPKTIKAKSGGKS